MRHVLVLIGLLIASQTVYAQLPSLKLEHLTTYDGLPSNDVWCLNKDQKGFLWIGTGRNLCRYDGYTFLQLDSLKLGYCSGVATDSKGNLFTSNDTRGLCRIDAKTMAVTTVVKNEYDDRDPTNDLHEQCLVDSYDQVWTCDYTSVQRYNPTTRKLRRYRFSATAPGGDVYQYASFFEDAHRTLWVVSELGLYRYDRRRDTLVCLLGREALRPENRILIRLCKASADATGALWIGAYEYGLIRFTPTNQSFRIWKKGFDQSEVTCARESQDENGRKIIVVGTNNGISIFYPDREEIDHLPEFHNSGLQVKDMYDDKANGILWIGTRGGIYKYRYRNVGIQTVDLPTNVVRLPVQITTILPDAHTGFCWLGLSHSGVLLWSPAADVFQLYPYPITASTQQLRWIRGHVYAFTDKGIFVDNIQTKRFVAWQPARQLFKKTDFRDGLLDHKGRFWIANFTEGLKILDPVTHRELKLWSDQEMRNLTHFTYIKGILEGVDGRIWVASCSRGLFYFDEKQAKFVNIETVAGNKGKRIGGDCINGLQRTADGSILITSWGGASKLSATGQIISTFEFKSDAINDTYCANIAEAPDKTLWFSTNEGINIANPQTRQVRYITTIEGLHSNAPVGFHYSSGQLLLGHTNTLNILDVNQLSVQESIPPIALSSIEVKGKSLPQDISKQIILQADENAITLSFSSLNYEPISKNRYKYQLVGADTAWVDLGDRHLLSFTNLAPGSYQLNIKSGNGSGIWTTNPLVVRFRIKPYFTATWWFRTLIGLLIAGLAVAMMRWRLNVLAERNQLDLQIAQWRLKALQSQMNPHFLFNSLNSVQNYLLTNRGIEGAKYLSKFSKLVRRIMENSNHPYLSFEQIIDTLKMYVEIESFRFNHEFTYNFQIEENETLLDAQLPPMLLQPYVENAIWHGLMPKQGQKCLWIRAWIEQDQIVCEIEDNGVGRQYAPPKAGHISRGQEMTRGIFESFRRKDRQARIELTDLVDAQNQPAGTQVRITISIEKHTEL